jgi:hemerythrin-like domain-containing protein
MVNEPYVGATPEQLQNPLVHELLGVHNLFRAQLEKMLRYINDLLVGEQQLTAAETNAQMQQLIRAGTQYTHMLHTHHTLETSMMFPALQDEGLEAAVVERLNAEHDEIGFLIDQFSVAIRQLSSIEPDVLQHDLRRLSDTLHSHLAYEETHVCPFLARFSHWPLR